MGEWSAASHKARIDCRAISGTGDDGDADSEGGGGDCCVISPDAVEESPDTMESAIEFSIWELERSKASLDVSVLRMDHVGEFFERKDPKLCDWVEARLAAEREANREGDAVVAAVVFVLAAEAVAEAVEEGDFERAADLGRVADCGRVGSGTEEYDEEREDSAGDGREEELTEALSLLFFLDGVALVARLEAAAESIASSSKRFG